MKKAIKINVTTQKVEEVFISDYTDIYKEIGNGCNLFCCPVEFENGDCLYADDEALLQENVEGCFAMENFRYPIVGNAIILGTDEEGESTNAKTNISDLNILFGDKTVAEEYRKSAMMRQPEIYTF